MYHNLKYLSFLIILLLIASCRTEKYYYQKAYNNLDSNLEEGDTLIFPFKGKANSFHQYWRGNLIAYHSNGKMKMCEFGKWQQYNPKDPAEIWTTTAWDTLGHNLVLYSEVYNNYIGQLSNRVVCKDTLLNSVQIRKCDYRWYFDDGKLKHQYSIVTFGNPGESGQKYGSEIIYERGGGVKSTVPSSATHHSASIKLNLPNRFLAE
jgi:hypothetical protein